MNRPYDKQEIGRLLEKFMAGKTSLNEEDVLAQYFRSHEVDEVWTAYKEMFALFDSGAVDIESDADASAAKGKTKTVALRWLMTGIAAGILLLIGFFLLTKEGEPGKETPAVAQLTVGQETPQPQQEPVVEEMADEVVAEAAVQPSPQPVKKRRRAIRKPVDPAPAEEVQLAESAPTPTEAEDPAAESDSPAPTYYPSAQDPFVEMAAQVENIRLRGKRLQREIAGIIEIPELMNN